MNRGNHRTARRALAGLVVATVLALPAQASAAGAGVTFGVLGIASGADAAKITVTRQGGNVVVADPTQSLGAGNGCSTTGSPAKVVCSATGVTSIVAVLGDGNDRFDSTAVALPTTVNGGNDADQIATGPSVDVLNGGAGNDVFAARDGAVDNITCGSGADSGQVDANDTLSGDCEAAVERPALPPSDPPADNPPAADQPAGTAPTAADDPAADADPTADDTAADDPADADTTADDGLVAPIAISVPSTLVLSPEGDITIRVACTADTGTCKGTVELIEEDGALKTRTITAARRRKTATKGVVLGRKSFSVRAGEQKSVRIRLARNGRQRIIKKKKRKTKARIVISMLNPDGTLVTTEKTVTISPPKERRTSSRGRAGRKKRGSR